MIWLDGESCEGEDYTPQRADDLPAYLVIAIDSSESQMGQYRP
jgi:uncharacterized protein (DUF983 family)